MTKLTAMRGYSGSGKSTKAAQIAKETGAVVVNRDYLRKMLLGEWWTGRAEDEDRVTVAEEAQVDALLRAGASVCVDATHLHPPYLRKWARLATRLGVEFEVADCRTRQADCAIRNMDRRDRGERSVEGAVISGQARRFPMHKWPTITAEPFTVEPVADVPAWLPPAIIVDIDGTLAHIPEGGRSPYDYSRVNEDVIDGVIGDIVTVFSVHVEWLKVLVVSGRDASCYDETFKWLKDNNVPFHDLIMRPADDRDEHGNKLPDYQVKYRLFNEHIRGKYNVWFVLDDRTQVVEMWRQLGLKCLQVAPGDF